VATHAELEQKGVAAGHAVPQLPQFMPSEVRFAQAAPHVVSGAAQTHAELTHVCIAPHAMAH
jgi:hypothetical protein